MVVLVGPDHRAAASLVKTLAAGSMVDEHIDGGGGHVVNVPGRGARPPLSPPPYMYGLDVDLPCESMW